MSQIQLGGCVLRKKLWMRLKRGKGGRVLKVCVLGAGVIGLKVCVLEVC